MTTAWYSNDVGLVGLTGDDHSNQFEVTADANNQDLVPSQQLLKQRELIPKLFNLAKRSGKFK